MSDYFRPPTFSMFPPVVKNLIIINVLCFATTLILLYSHFNIDITRLLGLYYFELPNFKIYQIVTCMFMHDPTGITHILFNMFALWMFGAPLENLWGSKKFLIFYLVCGIGASLSQEAFQFFHVMGINEYSIGASGAIFGVLLAFGMEFPNTHIYFIFFPVPIKAKYAVIIYGVVELVAGVANIGQVAHFVHLGGMLFGFLMIMYWRSQRRR